MKTNKRASYPTSKNSRLKEYIRTLERINTIQRKIIQEIPQIDWNEEYQSLWIKRKREDPSNVHAKVLLRTQIGDLATKFGKVALQLGKIIIEEKKLPPEHRTIQSLDIGMAGVSNIFRATSFSRFHEKQNPLTFKFAVDEKGIYGGEENAFKAAAHDMKVHESRIG
jgi:hypothetical protein